MTFIDEVKIYVIAGNGGNGCCSFRREKYVPRGGPDGGDGGRGGDVILIGDPQVGTLLDLRYNRHQKGDRGVHGKGKQMTGRRGKPKMVRVPLGTVAYDMQSGELIGEIVEKGQKLKVASGGRGGRGNARFVSATNRAPRRCDPGETGEEKELRLELKLLADVGLVGFPNVGKSTFISVISKARPKISDYPFTTLVPNLGVVQGKFGDSFVVADIPGLIEGASEGHGLGIRFLRHVERCSILLHLVEFNEERGNDPFADYLKLKNELEKYDPTMLKKPQVAALNKIDLYPDEEDVEKLRNSFKEIGVEFFEISAAAHQNLDPLLAELEKHIEREEQEIPELSDLIDN